MSDPQMTRNPDSGDSYGLPPFLEGVCSVSDYKRWLQRKSTAHVKRDRKRGVASASIAIYKREIHEAVLRCQGLDAYTGLPLRWDLISKYDNNQSSSLKLEYKRQFSDLPTIDHVIDEPDGDQFRICSWKLNDCKSDLSLREFLNVCKLVLKHHSI